MIVGASYQLDRPELSSRGRRLVSRGSAVLFHIQLACQIEHAVVHAPSIHLSDPSQNEDSAPEYELKDPANNALHRCAPNPR
jgi:hypothetical protein